MEKAREPPEDSGDGIRAGLSSQRVVSGAALQGLPVSSAIGRSAAKPIISCRNVASEPLIRFAAQASSLRRAILSPVIVGSSGLSCVSQPTPTEHSQ